MTHFMFDWGLVFVIKTSYINTLPEVFMFVITEIMNKCFNQTNMILFMKINCAKSGIIKKKTCKKGHNLKKICAKNA